MTANDGLDIAAFAAAFGRLMQEVHELAPKRTQSKLARSIAAHLGVDPADLPVVSQSFPDSDHPNVQLALERLAAEGSEWELFGLPVETMHWAGFGLTNLASPSVHGPPFDAIAPAYVNVPIDVDVTLPCVTLGVWLSRHEGAPVVVLTSLGDPHRPMGGGGLKLEAMCEDRDRAVAFLSRVQALAHELNVYRGKVLSFTFTEWGSFGLEFHRMPGITRDVVIELAARDTIPVVERLFDAYQLNAADEVFICSTLELAVPVVQIDGRPIGDGKPGPLTRRMGELLIAEMDAEARRYKNARQQASTAAARA